MTLEKQACFIQHGDIAPVSAEGSDTVSVITCNHHLSYHNNKITLKTLRLES